MNLEDVLVGEGLADREVVAAAAERAGGDMGALVSALVGEGGIAEDALADALARAVGTVVIDVDQGALEIESIALVPEAMAREHLMIPVSPDAAGRSLSVAFVNPLDEDAVRMVRDLTGFDVQPLVGTMSAVLRAIEREYGRLRTQQPRPRSEMPAEITRRVESRFGRRDGEPGTSTSPIHRIEHEAPLEQRFEALLLALIEAGVVTRSDYFEALRRLMGRDG